MFAKLLTNKITLTIIVTALIMASMGVLFWVNNSTKSGQDLGKNTDNSLESIVQKAAVEFGDPMSASGLITEVTIDPSLDAGELYQSFDMTDDSRISIYKIGSVSETEDIYQFPINFVDTNLRDSVLKKLPDFEILSNTSPENVRQIAFYNKVLDTWRLPDKSIKDLLIISHLTFTMPLFVTTSPCAKLRF